MIIFLFLLLSLQPAEKKELPPGKLIIPDGCSYKYLTGIDSTVGEIQCGDNATLFFDGGPPSGPRSKPLEHCEWQEDALDPTRILQQEEQRVPGGLRCTRFMPLWDDPYFHRRGMPDLSNEERLALAELDHLAAKNLKQKVGKIEVTFQRDADAGGWRFSGVRTQSSRI